MMRLLVNRCKGQTITISLRRSKQLPQPPEDAADCTLISALDPYRDTVA